VHGREKIIQKHDMTSHRRRETPSYRVADVRVDVVFDVFEHFVEVAGARGTQEASVAISLPTHTHTQTHGCSCWLASSP